MGQAYQSNRRTIFAKKVRVLFFQEQLLYDIYIHLQNFKEA